MQSESRSARGTDLPDRLAGRADYFRAKRDAFASPRDVQELRADESVDSQVVDVRVGPPDLLEERVPGAIHVPQPAVLDRLDEFSTEAVIVVYCWDTWCSLATRAAIPLVERGYDVRELHGGIAAWNTLELPTEAIDREGASDGERPGDPGCGC